MLNSISSVSNNFADWYIIVVLSSFVFSGHNAVNYSKQSLKSYSNLSLGICLNLYVYGLSNFLFFWYSLYKQNRILWYINRKNTSIYQIVRLSHYHEIYLEAVLSCQQPDIVFLLLPAWNPLSVHHYIFPKPLFLHFCIFLNFFKGCSCFFYSSLSFI